MFLHPVTPFDILNIVHAPKWNKSTGIANVSPKVLQSVIKCIAEQLSAKFNNSLTEGVFPDLLKIAKVVPYINLMTKVFVLTNYKCMEFEVKPSTGYTVIWRTEVYL